MKTIDFCYWGTMDTYVIDSKTTADGVSYNLHFSVKGKGLKKAYKVDDYGYTEITADQLPKKFRDEAFKLWDSQIKPVTLRKTMA